MAGLTPMMQKYVDTKKEYPDCILFYRLGDFYEMFFEDAVTASRELEIALTGKDCGLPERAPMCGIPYHASDGYLSKLVQKGYKVAICEQVEDPKEAKGLVKREVVRIVTPGTILEGQNLDAAKNNYILCLFGRKGNYGISTADISTGEYLVTEFSEAGRVVDEITRFSPAEILCSEEVLESGAILSAVEERLGISVTKLDRRYFEETACKETLQTHFKVNSLQGLGVADYDCGIISAGALLQYLQETQKNDLSHLTHLTPYVTGQYMLLDGSTRRNLEISETLREKQKKGSLLWVLDKTRTAMGARTLRKLLEQPLIERKAIERRLDAVEELKEQAISREEMREYLCAVYDLERIIARITYGTANPRDLTAFCGSLEMLPPLRYLLESMQSELLQDLRGEMDDLSDLRTLLQSAIAPEPPLAMKEGGIIRDGYSREVDELRSIKSDGKMWLAKLEETEREKTGIKNLKIKYNKVFGYYLEVTNSYKNLVPEEYVRKQTLANAERYSTPKLKELEDKILGAEDRLYGLEYELYCQVREKIAGEVERIQKTAVAVAWLDVLASLALVAEKNQYVRPEICEGDQLEIKNGRHPVVEQMLPSGTFICNDTYLNGQNQCISIITGPNMAGKSTYMRQVALIVLMAQAGSFVPTEEARIGLVDRIFTRVGASDDLASGQSTFMVEMNEVANILRNATRKSLLVLDEIGRGTSTFDGLSIAWAVVEYISNTKLLGARTLFATHYHELTELEGKIANVNNYCIAVKEQGDDIVFLRKIIKGGADKSYGIQVAKLAGVPDLVINRAKEIAAELLAGDLTERISQIAVKDLGKTGSVSEKREDSQGEREHAVVARLREMDLGHITPLEALNVLYELQEKAKE